MLHAKGYASPFRGVPSPDSFLPLCAETIRMLRLYARMCPVPVVPARSGRKAEARSRILLLVRRVTRKHHIYKITILYVKEAGTHPQKARKADRISLLFPEKRKKGTAKRGRKKFLFFRPFSRAKNRLPALPENLICAKLTLYFSFIGAVMRKSITK